jgi:hypothetical protein
MLSDITSDQPDSIQCRHCGVTLAARLLSCPACGANQADSRDPLDWYPPASSSAKARLPASPASIAPQLAAPAAWNTPAGAEDDRFYAKHDPWDGPSRPSRLPFVGALVTLLVLAVAGYFVFRPGSEVASVAPKAVSGSVTAQKAGQVAAVPAPVSAPAPAVVPAPAPAARVAGPVDVKPAASAPFVARQVEPPVSAPKAVVPIQTAQNSTGLGSAAMRPSIASGTVVQRSPAQSSAVHASAAQTSATQTSARPTAQVSNPPAPKPAAVAKPAETLAAVPHPAVSPATPTKRDVAGNPDQTHPDVTTNLQIAHAMLQRDNLAAAESRVAAVLAVQPKNRDALSMREDLSARQQQRDAALDLARGCAYMERWTCAWHNAGNALVIDSSSADAKRIVAQAMREAQSGSAPAPVPATDSSREPPPHH